MIYDYKCLECEETFEVRATLAEKEQGLEPECPQCGAKKTRQMMSAFMIGGGARKTGAAPPACGPGAGPGCCSR